MTDLVSRSEWGARSPSTTLAEIGQVDTIFIHHSVTSPTGDPKADARQIQNFHMDSRHYADIAYTLLVHPITGEVLEGRTKGAKAAQGAHTSGWNSRSVAICAIGNYETGKPTAKLVDGINEAIAICKNKGWVVNNPKIRPHSDVGSTACCGKYLKELIPSFGTGQPAPNPIVKGVIVTESIVFSNVKANKLDGEGNGYTDVPHGKGKDPLYAIAVIENGFNGKYPSHHPLLYCSALNNSIVRVTIVGGAPNGQYSFDLRCDW